MNRERSPEELIVLCVCAICFSGLVPFVFIRVSYGDFVVASIDSIGAVATALCFWYVYRTGAVKKMAPVIGLLALVGMTFNILMLGPNDIFFLYPVILSVFFLMPPLIALAKTLIATVVVTFIVSQSLPFFDALKILFSLLATVSFTFVFAWMRNRQRQELIERMRIDPLTGAGNRYALRDRLDELIHMHSRDRQPMSLIILDLDDFKIINDQHGHIAGDEVLVLVADLVKSRIRETDYFYRYGGDEFMILANHSDLLTTEILAEDIRSLIYQAALVAHKPISVSMGVSEYIVGETPDEWLMRADNAMYSVKRSGKNGVSKLSAGLPFVSA